MRSIRSKSLIFILLIFILFIFSMNITVNATPNPVVGETYRSWVGNEPIIDELGEPDHAAFGIGMEKKVLYKDAFFPWNKEYVNVPDIMYIVYKFPVRINARIEKLSEEYIYVPAGVSKSSTYTKTKEYGYIYEESACTEIARKESTSKSLSGGFGLYGFSIGGKISNNTEISSKISTTITRTTSYKYLTNVSETFTINSLESSYYSYERRALFDVYVCQVYKNNYNVYKDKEQHFIYEDKNFTLLEQNMKLTYVDDTLEIGYYKYKKNINGEFVYNDNKVSTILHY